MKLKVKILKPLKRQLFAQFLITRRRLAARLCSWKTKKSLPSKSKAMIVYDNHCSPPTYGDLIYVLLLGRFFEAKCLQLTFLIVTTDVREDWANLGDEDKITSFISEQQALASFLLSDSTDIRLVSWLECQKIIENVPSDVYFFQKKRALTRQPIYHLCFNTLSHLLSDASSETIEKMLLSGRQLKSKLQDPTFELPRVPYIAYSCRFNTAWGTERNLSEEEFLETLTTLQTTYPTYLIVVISNSDGCAHFKKIAKKCNLKISTSRDFSTGFLGDTCLALNSNLFLQIRGGGMATVTIFSNTPYIIALRLINEIPWKSAQLVPWKTPYQYFIDDEALPAKILIETVNNEVK